MKKPVKGMWYKATASDNGNQCVEVFQEDDAVSVRHSMDPNGPALRFTPGEWDAFVSGAKVGEFDRP